MARKALSRLKRAPGDRCQPPPSNLQYPPCNNVGNDVISCYPLANTTLQQDTWTKVIWNINHPKLAQFGHIDVYLLSFDTQAILASWKDQPTSQGQVSSCTDDVWFTDAGANAFNGTAIPWHFQWLLVQAGTTITGGEPKETRFTVMQTHLLDAQLDAISSSSSAAAALSSSAAAASSASSSADAGSSSTSVSGQITTTLPDGTTTTIPPQGGLQNGSSSNSFPHWAIALLAVFGFLALLAVFLVMFYVLRETRRRRRKRDRARRESMGSESPMMAAIGAPASPQSPEPVGRGGPGAAPLGRNSFPRSYRGHDASSTTSHTDSGPFSGADAVFIANAFRDTLRRPDFKDRPLEEGESPDALSEKPTDPVMSRELAEEGRDIRSVHSVRGVKVESLIDHERDS